ncbi:MAG: metal ABC transporter solute-binding protein, Zn/Mn family [Gemmataceae bacterium]
MIIRIGWMMLLLGLINLAGCNRAPQHGILATTTLAADLVRSLLPPDVPVETLMGPGVDPHTFEARSGSIRQLHTARLIVHHGLHLEGRLADLIDGLELQTPNRIHSLATPLIRDHNARLRREGEEVDPHVWFSPSLWRATVPDLAAALRRVFPEHAEKIATREEQLLQSLANLDSELRVTLSAIPPENRILVTSHDAFGYWAADYGFEVHAIQGISTATEVAESTLRELANLITRTKIPAGFVESSVSPRTVEKLRQLVGPDRFRIGGELYSDSLGPPGSPAGTYAGMLRHNANLMVAALGTAKHAP